MAGLVAMTRVLRLGGDRVKSASRGRDVGLGIDDDAAKLRIDAGAAPLFNGEETASEKRGG